MDNKPKTIDTLVEDIYHLFDNPEYTPSEEAIKELGERFAKLFSRRLSNASRRDNRSFSLSASGTPDRKLWFTIRKPEAGELLSAETRIKFLFGDMLEELLLFLVKEAGHSVEGEQDTVEVAGVKGHRDAIIDGRIVDCKSASSISFKKFQSNGLRDSDPFGYVSQLGSYLVGSLEDPKLKEKDVMSFLVIDKQLGKITLDTYPKPEVDYEKQIEHKKKVLERDTPPEEKCYQPVPEGKSGNEKLNVNCSYCPFKWHCWDGLRAFIYSTGPVYLSKVVSTPRVIEVDKDGNVVHNKEF